VSSANQRSTRLSQEPPVGVKCRWKRGWRNSQRLMAGVLWVSSAAIPWPSLVDLIYLASMIEDRLVQRISLGFEFGSADGACGEHELARPLRAPGLHAPLQAPELGAGRIEIWKLLG
jgi:hypothetical protein